MCGCARSTGKRPSAYPALKARAFTLINVHSRFPHTYHEENVVRLVKR